MSAQVSYKKQIIIFLTIFVLLIVAVEIGVRVIEYFDDNKCEFIGKDAFKNVEKIKQNQICKDNNSTAYEVDGILKYIPNQNMETININSHGFRGHDFSVTKDLDTYRIFIVGGSTVFGSGSTSDDTTIPSFLQKKFESIHNGKKIEILIENDLMKFQPDLIIIYSGGNDANNRYGVEYTVPGIPTSQLASSETPTDFVNLVKKFIKETNYRTPFLLTKIVGQYENNFHINNSSKNQVQELWTTRMGEICKESNKKEITTIILVQPMLGSGNKQLSIDEKILSENLGIYMVDTLDILNKISGSLAKLENVCHGTYDLRMVFDDVKESLFFDHMHVTDLGNEMIAEEIYKILTGYL